MYNFHVDVHSPAGVYTFSVWTVAADRCSPCSWIDGVSCRLRTCRAGTARKSRPFCKCSSYGDFEKKNNNKRVAHVIGFIPSAIYLSRGGDSTIPPFASLFFGFCLLASRSVRDHGGAVVVVYLSVSTYCCCCCSCRRWPPSAPHALLHICT